MPPVPHAKITVPALPPEFVVRAALRGELDGGATADVALVCAPAGYGKTLLLADWARSSTAADTAWVSLDRDDNDPERLWASIVAALAACPSVPGTSRLHGRWVWRAGAQPEFLDELVDAIRTLPRPIRLILDDLHELVDQEVLHGIQILTRNRPAGMQLVLSSRLDPPLSLPRLRMAGRLWELRAAQLRFSLPDTAALLEKSGLRITPTQVDLLHRRTGGWAAGLRLAAVGMAESADRDGFLSQFTGDERSVADYLVGEVLCGLPEDVQEFLRVISISEPVPTGLAAELSGREDAGSVLDGLENQTSLLSPTGQRRDAYIVQELLRTHLLADLRRQGLKRAAELHGVAARWWAGRPEPVHALDHAAQSLDSALLADLLHRFAVPLIVAGDHEPLRRALASAGAHTVAADPWLALSSALAHLEAGEFPAARADLGRARQSWPAHSPGNLTVLRTVAEQLSAGVVESTAATPPPAPRIIDELPAEPELEALARLSRGAARLERNDRAGARAEFEAALFLSHSHGFGYLAMQCLALLGVIAGATGDVQTMRAVSVEAVALATEHGWERSAWSCAATAMLAWGALLRTETAEAERLAAEGLAVGAATSSPHLRFALQDVHGAAAFDGGDRAGGLAELQQARSDLGNLPAGAQQVASHAMLEFGAALQLGHSTAARTVLGWLANRTGDNAEHVVMRALADAAGGRHEHARSLLRPVLEGAVTALLPQTMVDAWLLETTLALAGGERPAARRALQTALGLAEPLDALRPFTHAGPGIRELLVHQHGSFGASDAFAVRALAAGARSGSRQALLSERELTVLGLLPSLLSLDEIADDLTVSVNTVKSHVRSIYTKLGVSSRRLAVLAAHEHGLLASSVRQG
ncbi:LuxR C-terminal-related transcriptional regulator [Pseudonocardia adelaidensis]|uniref:LuxR C-terminal-related transcriptional regulator n=1 Tax=Pseudonocardia adelaidensis TaxID=648754 RepID=UPI0031E79D87